MGTLRSKYTRRYGGHGNCVHRCRKSTISVYKRSAPEIEYQGANYCLIAVVSHYPIYDTNEWSLF